MTQNHIGQVLLSRHHTAIAPAYTLNDNTDDAGCDGQEFVRELLWRFHERAGAAVQADQSRNCLHRRVHRIPVVHRADSSANGETLQHFAQGVSEVVVKLTAYTLVDHIERGVKQGACFQVLYLMALRQFEAYLVVWSNGEEGNIAIMPG